MNKDILSYYIYLMGMIFCIVIQLILGNVGIIFMIFLSVCLLHDFIQHQFNRLLLQQKEKRESQFSKDWEYVKTLNGIIMRLDELQQQQKEVKQNDRTRPKN